MKWNDLTMKERSDLMSLFLQHGIGSLSDMRRIYDGEQDTYNGGTLPAAQKSATLTRGQWNNLYRQGKVTLSQIPRKYQSYIQGDPYNSGMLETINSGRQKFLENAGGITKEIGEAAIDFIPGVGDIKGLIYDPYIAYKKDGLSSALINAGLGVMGIVPGVGDVAAKAGKAALKYGNRGLRVISMTPKHLAVRHKLLSNNFFTDNTERIRKNTFNYNLKREKEYQPTLTSPTVRLYKGILGTPAEVPDLNGTIKKVGTDVKLASWKDTAKKIMEEGEVPYGEAKGSYLGDIIIYPSSFSFSPKKINSFWKTAVPETLAHEFQHRAQYALKNKYYSRPVLNSRSPTPKTTSAEMPRWGTPDVNNPAYKEMSILEGRDRDDWIQSANEVDSEMALIRERLGTDAPFNLMTSKQQNAAVSYISDVFDLSIEDTRKMLSSMSDNFYNYGGKLKKKSKRFA